MATDCDALAYQAAALSDTVRLVGFLRPGFLVRRLIVLLLPTRTPLLSAPAALICRSGYPAHITYFTPAATACEGPERRAGQHNLKIGWNDLDYLELFKVCTRVERAVPAPGAAVPPAPLPEASAPCHFVAPGAPVMGALLRATDASGVSAFAPR